MSIIGNNTRVISTTPMLEIVISRKLLPTRKNIRNNAGTMADTTTKIKDKKFSFAE